MTRDGWSPTEYANFRDARRRPFFDLLQLVRPGAVGTVLDAGCGTGELTAEAHRLLGARRTLGVDSSPAMLARGAVGPGVQLEPGTIPHGLPEGPFDVVLSNSALNWVADHRVAVRALAQRVAAGGRLAVQMPSNPDSAFSRCAELVARSAAFCGELDGYVYQSPVEEPAFYSALLDELGFAEQRVGTWFYPQVHEQPAGVAAFARGGLLSVYRERLAPERFEAFATAYAAELERALGPGRVFFPFRRVFLWGLKGPEPDEQALMGPAG